MKKNKKINIKLDRTSINLSIGERKTYTRPLTKAGYKINIKHGTINDHNVSDYDKRDTHLQAKLNYLLTVKKFILIK